MEKEQILYFAYGSNLNTSQMKVRCPLAEKMDKAILKDYKFIINTRGVATIIKSEKDIVEGGLYKVTKDCVASLDRYEGVRENCYFRKTVQVIHKGKSVDAICYFATDEKEGRPRLGYIEKIIEGANEFCLIENYIKNSFKRYLK